MVRNMNEQCIEALNSFPFAGEVVGALPYGEGHVHETYCVHIQGENTSCTKYILQKINTYAFKKPEELMENITLISDFLREQAMEHGEDPDLYLTVMRTRDQKSFFKDSKGEYWRVYPFIENSMSFHRIESPKQFYEAAKAFGNFQKQLSGFDAQRLHTTIDRFHDTRNRFALLEDAVQNNFSGRLEDVQEELKALNDRKDKAPFLIELHERGELPVRVTHNDTKLNNVLFDRYTGRAIAVIDLDTVMPGLSAFDFGDAIRFGCNQADEDERDLSKVRFDHELYEVFVKGFLEGTDGALTDKEIEVLPWGAYIMTYENAIRFLTDHLDGDKYFHITRNGHNLDRCRTQIRLLEEMEKNWDRLQIQG